MLKNKNTNKGRYNKKMVKPEYDQKIVDIARTARVMKGGRRFSFRVTIVAGNRKGRVGVGVGKSSDTSTAIDKAFRDAKKHFIDVSLTKGGSLPHEVEAKNGSSFVALRPAPSGRGLVAGSSVRVVLDFVGVKNVSAKVLSRSKNKLNNARATISALQKLK